MALEALLAIELSEANTPEADIDIAMGLCELPACIYRPVWYSGGLLTAVIVTLVSVSHGSREDSHDKGGETHVEDEG
jgi:hypothetical protein